MFEPTAVFAVGEFAEAVGDKRRNEDRKLSLSVLDVFILFFTLSARTVIFRGVLSIQHQQATDAKFNGHCNPHSGKPEAFDQN